MAKTTDDDLLRAVLKDIETAENYYEDRIQPAVEEAVKIYNADEDYYNEKFPELSKRSKFTTKDVANTIETIMPDMMKLLLGSDEIVSMKPTGAEDVENADVMQDLVKHQFLKQNKGYKLTYRWVKASLYKKIGVVKCSWNRETKWKEQTHAFDLNNPMEFQAYEQLIQAGHDGKVKIKDSKDFNNGLFQVTAEHEHIVKNQPQIDYMDHSEFLFIPVSLDINDTMFSAHKMTKTIDELRRKQKEGIYKKEDVDKVIASTASNSSSRITSTDDTQYQEDKADYSDDGTQKARRPITVYECYGKYDMDGSEIMEEMIVTVANGVILRKEKNEMERNPFFPMIPLFEPDDILGKCISDLVADFQHLKIAMMRQVIINTGLSNKPKYFYNAQAINGKYLAEDLEYIPVNADKNSGINNMVVQEQMTNIAPWTMKVIEYSDKEKQQTSGITDYSMGMGSDLNKSKTKGESEILASNGNKRIEMIARNIVETGFVELYSHMVNLNLKFIDQEQVMRVTGKQLNVNPDEFAEAYDVEVSAGLGMGSKEGNMKAMQFVGTVFPELAQMMPMFAQNPPLFDKWRAQKGRLLEEMGIKDIDTYLPTKEEIFAPMMQQQQQAQQQQMMMQQQGGMPPQQQGMMQ